MSRSSPGVARVVAILNFFADHPGQSFTLTDLVRALKLSRATCHGLLAGLVDAGYLYRSSDKSYVLGPALTAIGEAARQHFSPIQVAQPEMRALADQFDATCSAVFRERGDVVVRERATALAHLGSSVHRGARLPLRPEFASAFFVWSPAAAVTAWLDDLDPAPTERQRQVMQDGIEFLRRHGFFVGVRNVRQEFAGQSTEWLYDPADSDKPIVPLLEIEPDQEYHLGFVNAPVHDARREAAFVLALQGFSGTCTGAEIMQAGQRLREACDRITAFIAHPVKPRG